MGVRRLPRALGEQAGAPEEPDGRRTDRTARDAAVAPGRTAGRQARKAARRMEPELLPRRVEEDIDIPCPLRVDRRERDPPMVEQRGEQAGYRRIARIAERVGGRPARQRVGEDDDGARLRGGGVEPDKFLWRKRAWMSDEQGIFIADIRETIDDTNVQPPV